MTSPQGDVLAGHKNGGEVLFGLVDVAIHRFLLQSCFKCLPEASRLDLPIASGEQHIGACPMIGPQAIVRNARSPTHLTVGLFAVPGFRVCRQWAPVLSDLLRPVILSVILVYLVRHPIMSSDLAMCLVPLFDVHYSVP